MKRKILLGFFLLIFWNFAQAQTTPLSLQEAINYALDNSLSVQKARLDLADAEKQINERRALGMPKLNGSLGYNYYIDIPTSILPPFFPKTNLAFAQNVDPTGNPIPVQVTQLDANGQPVFGDPQEVQFGLKHNATAGLQLQSLLFDWTYFTALKAAREFKSYTEKNYKVTEREVRNNVIDAYLPTLILNENIAILDSNLVNLKRLKFETEESYKAGFVEQLDVDRLKLSIANLEVQKEALLRQKETVENALKFAINMDSATDIILTDDIDALLSDPMAEDLTGDINIEARPELAVINKGLELNDLNIEAKKAAYYPSISGFLNYQQQYQGDKLSGGNWFPTTIVGLQANIPIYGGGQRKAEMQRAKIQKEVSLIQKKQFEQGVSLEIRTVRINYLSAKDRVDNQKDNLELAERIYNTTIIKYREGVGSSLEVSTAEQQLYSTQQIYTTALYDLLVAKYSLQKALGK